MTRQSPSWTVRLLFERSGPILAAARTTPCTRRCSRRLAKDAREMALIGEAAIVGDLGQRKRGIEKKLFCAFDTEAPQPAKRRCTGRLPERADETARRQPAGTRDIDDVGLVSKISGQKL